MEKRSHETSIEIDATVEEVWRAITEPAGLDRWFAPRNEVAPGVGGYLLGDWGPGLEWRTAIEVWEPNRRLRLTEERDRVLSSSPATEKVERCRLVEDFFLSTANGKTVLRLVHSGFGASSAWDGEFEGTRGGWASCFFRLKQGLELHRHDPVHNILIPAVCHGVDRTEAMRRIESELPQPLDAVLRRDWHLYGVLPRRSGSIFGVNAQESREGCVLYVEILLFAHTPAQAAAFENEWRARLTEMFDARAASRVV